MDVSEALDILDTIINTHDESTVLASVIEYREKFAEPPSIIMHKIVFPERDDLARLREENLALKARLGQPAEHQVIRPEKGEPYYNLADFHAALLIKRGGSHAWKVSYVEASTQDGCRLVKNEDIAKWQRTKQVPIWAYEQITVMKFFKRAGKNSPDWTQEEYDYLRDTYNEDPTRQNKELAYRCSVRFERTITEQAIKGALDRLRGKGQVGYRKELKIAAAEAKAEAAD